MSFPIRGWRSILILCWRNGGPRSLPQAVTKAKVLGSPFPRTCHQTQSLFTWRQCEQESVLYDLYAGRVTTVPTQIWFGSS